MKQKHFMLDNETFGVVPYSALIAIGAVWFDPNLTGDEAIKERFYVTIDAKMAQDAGFRVMANTVLWWLHPDQRPAWDNYLSIAHFPPDLAFQGFSMWLDEIDKLDPPDEQEPDEEGLKVAHRVFWGNGPGFDNELLRHGYNMLKMSVPWKHWNDRCYRTFKNLPRAANVKPDWQGVKHNGQDDAEWQARHLCNIIKEYGLTI